MAKREPTVRYSPDSETLIAVELDDGRFTVVNVDGTSQIVWGDTPLGGARVRDWPLWHPERTARAKEAIAEAKEEIQRALFDDPVWDGRRRRKLSRPKQPLVTDPARGRCPNAGNACFCTGACLRPANTETSWSNRS